MQVQLLVERMGQSEYIAKLGGSSYRFKRNEHGHMVCEITDAQVITKISDPRNGSFRPYSPPEVQLETEAVLGDDASLETKEIYKCDICEKEFDTKLKLQGHKGGAHKGN